MSNVISEYRKTPHSRIQENSIMQRREIAIGYRALLYFCIFCILEVRVWRCARRETTRDSQGSTAGPERPWRPHGAQQGPRRGGASIPKKRPRAKPWKDPGPGVSPTRARRKHSTKCLWEFLPASHLVIIYLLFLSSFWWDHKASRLFLLPEVVQPCLVTEFTQLWAVQVNCASL